MHKDDYNFLDLQIKTRYHRIRKYEYKNQIPDDLKLIKPIFIVGMPHSGTSVFVDTFSKHKDLANWSEASEVWEPNWVEGMENNDFDKLIPKHEKDVTDIDSFRVTDVFFKFVKSQNKKRLVNKNPRNIVRINYIKKIFPDAKIIHTLRDGREVINSISRNMPDQMTEEICDRWVNSISELIKQVKKIPKDDFFEIKYEEFCKDPRGIVKAAYEKCDLEFNPYLQKLIPAKLPNFNGSWKKEINSKYHNMIKKKIEPIFNQIGYKW